MSSGHPPEYRLPLYHPAPDKPMSGNGEGGSMIR